MLYLLSEDVMPMSLSFVTTAVRGADTRWKTDILRDMEVSVVI